MAGREHVAALGGRCSRPAARNRKTDAAPASEQRDQGVERGGRGGRASAASIADRCAKVAREWLQPKGKRLVIVESPAKAKTIAGYLGDDYMVESSIGHIRDLPHSAAEVPEAHEEGAVGAARRQRRRTTSSRSTSSIRRRRRSSPSLQARSSRTPTSSCSRRTRTARARRSPGTSSQVLKPKVPVRRMVFHEITKGAIERALERDARDRRPPRRRAGDAAHPRPALRLRGLARALAEGDAGALGRARAVGRDAARRRARARADGVRRRRVLGHRRRRSTRAAFDGAARARRRHARRAGPRLRPRRRARPTPTPCSSTRRRRAGSPTRSTAPSFAVRSVERQAVHAPAGARRS